MAGAEIRLTIDDRELRARLLALQSKLADPSPAMAEIAEVMLNGVHDRFDSETAPDGGRWQAHSAATIARRGGRATLLRERGRLIGSIHPASDRTSARVGTNLVYGAIHQFGGQAGRGHATKIPARPYLGFSYEDELRVAEVLEVWLA
jgi:phage virion morphogenesis protein